MPGMSDEYRECLDAVAFRLWRRVRPLLKWASGEWLGKIFAVAGIIVAVAALAVRGLDWPALIIAVLALLPVFGYGLDRRIKRVAMRRAAGPDAKIHPHDFLCAPLKLDPGYRLSRPAGTSIAQLYPYVDLSDHDVFIHMENPDISREERAAVYERWYNRCPDAFMHLEKMVDGVWRPISISIMLPVSKEGYRTITARATGHRISVIDLDDYGILPRPASKNPIVLIDTWIVDRPGGFGGPGHGKTAARGGNANLLVLRHLAQFWNSANKFRPMVFLVETDNQRLIPALVSMSFQNSGVSKIGETFYRTDRSQFDTLAPAEFKRIKDTVRVIENLTVVPGTTPRPERWYY